MSNSDGLPKGWAKTRLGDCLHIIRGISFPTTAKAFEPKDGYVACLRTANVQREVEWSDLWYVPKEYVKREEQYVHQNDILISNANSYELVGKVSQVKDIPCNASLGAFISLIRVPNCLSPQFMYFLLTSSQTQARLRGMASTTTNISNISTGKLAELELAIAPINEQRRIVAKIEELFSDLDAGVAALERAKANLKRYRAAVLKAAVEGKLTEQWRAEHPAKEAAPHLLARILKERRHKWEEAQTAAYAKSGKKPPANWRNKYKEPAAPDETNLPELPEGWCWTTLDSVALIDGGITKDQKRPRSPTMREVPYLRVANVQRGYLDLAEMKDILAEEAEIEALRLQKGDILFTEGGDRDKLGRGWVWNEEIDECIHQNHIFRARLISDCIQPKFVSYHGNYFGQRWFVRTGKQTTNLASINKGVLSRFPIPLAPVEEQEQIVSEADWRLSLIQESETQIEANLKRSARLRQSILKRAFEGNLVPQDPTDEPASGLLGRKENLAFYKPGKEGKMVRQVSGRRPKVV